MLAGTFGMLPPVKPTTTARPSQFKHRTASSKWEPTMSTTMSTPLSPAALFTCARKSSAPGP
eukprot:CAMPEP_0180716304 /NCGR_PEP_ID=MMETSP1038_2-20121128/13388_1 /TAXON_ID=632150 /ORGANISM="Azadinium spinosum, Strain 3D9" /LENGTH=61 /DNA_ID=CAMNT_0022748735 /DNA_START=188 /DNA_END=373 /DNA_ORIENTATION=+